VYMCECVCLSVDLCMCSVQDKALGPVLKQVCVCLCMCVMVYGCE
jgi:type III secretory pathway component EscS